MKIFVVTSGDYSSYSIKGIFDEKAKAEEFVAHLNACGSLFYQADVEEWELNQFYDEIHQGLTYFEVYFDDISNGDARVWPADVTDEAREMSNRRNHYSQQRDYRITLWAKDEEGALKIANERRVHYLLRKEQEENPHE